MSSVIRDTSSNEINKFGLVIYSASNKRQTISGWAISRTRDRTRRLVLLLRRIHNLVTG